VASLAAVVGRPGVVVGAPTAAAAASAAAPAVASVTADLVAIPRVIVTAAHGSSDQRERERDESADAKLIHGSFPSFLLSAHAERVTQPFV